MHILKRRTTLALAVGAVAAALALTGCSGGAGGSGGGDSFKVVAFTSGNQTAVGAWWMKAMDAKAKELGWDLTMVQGDFDFQKMNPAVESAIGQGADVVLDGYTDIASIGSIATAAQDAGVPIFAIDSATEPVDAFALDITTDQQMIADQTLKAITDALGGTLKGKTVMILGHDPHPGIRKRQELTKQALVKAGATVAGGDVQKIASPTTGTTEALKIVQDYLAAHPNGLDAIWTGWDDAALGAAQAVTEAGSSAVVTGVNAGAAAIDNILKGGPIIATSLQPWPEVNDAVVAAIETYRKDGTLPEKNYEGVASTLVDKTNASDVTPSDKLG